MCDCYAGPVDKKEPRIRETVDACWNCKNLNISTDAEHEDGGGIPYCLMDGCDVHLFNKCEDWKKDYKK